MEVPSSVGQFGGFKIKRIIIYPLLLHSLKNFTTLAWDKLPCNIRAAKRKRDAFQSLLAELAADQQMGGWRVEFRFEGHGDPYQWLQSMKEFVEAQYVFDATVSTTNLTVNNYLQQCHFHLSRFSNMLHQDNTRVLHEFDPIIDKFKSISKIFGFSELPLDNLILDQLDENNRPHPEPVEDLEDQEPVPMPMVQRAPPEMNVGLEFEAWSAQEKDVWNMVPCRITHCKFGRGRPAWWVRSHRGQMLCKCNTAHEAVHRFIALQEQNPEI